jgi:hypothetical protein
MSGGALSSEMVEEPSISKTSLIQIHGWQHGNGIFIYYKGTKEDDVHNNGGGGDIHSQAHININMSMGCNCLHLHYHNHASD